MNPEPTNSERQSATRPRHHRANRVDHRARAHEAFRREVRAATDPNGVNCRGERWLHRALFRADVDAVSTLLDRGADPNRTNDRGWTPLHVAVVRGEARSARTLLDRGADPNLRDSTGWSPLDRAVARDHCDLAELLLDRGADVRATDARGVTPLHRAPSESVAKLLLDRGADPRARDGSGRTAIEREPVARAQFERCVADLERVESKGGGQSERARNSGAIRRLLDGGLDPGSSGTKGDTVLHRAASDGDTRLLASLLAHGADLNARNAYGKVPLHLACDAESARLLLRHGADPDARDNRGKVPLHLACDAESARLLLRHGADPDARDNRGEAPLHRAHNAEIVRVLLEHGADPNARDNEGTAPLRFTGSGREAHLLLEHGADPGVVSVCMARDPEWMRVLLEHGADPNARNDDGGTALHQPHVVAESVRVLMEHGADPNARNNDGATPLHLVHYDDSARILLERGADPDARNNDGATPLHLAVARSSWRARILLERGADPDIADAAGVTALEHFVECPDAALVLLNGFPDPAAPNDWERALLDALLETYGDPGATANLRDDISLVGLQGTLQAGRLPEGAERVVVTVRLARAVCCPPHVRDWLQAHVPNADPNDLDFSLPVAEVMRLGSRDDDPSEWARIGACAIRLAHALARARGVASD